jgi:hypothetical protein
MPPPNLAGPTGADLWHASNPPPRTGDRSDPCANARTSTRRGSVTGCQRCRRRSRGFHLTCSAAPRRLQVWTPAQGIRPVCCRRRRSPPPNRSAPVGPAASVVALRSRLGSDRRRRVSAMTPRRLLDRRPRRGAGFQLGPAASDPAASDPAARDPATSDMPPACRRPNVEPANLPPGIALPPARTPPRPPAAAALPGRA